MLNQLPTCLDAGSDVRETSLCQILSLLRFIYRPRKDAVLPFSTPITGIDGRVMNEIVVPKDTTVIISIINCNRDPALWGPDSYEWKPERWLSPLPATVSEAPVPGIYSHL
jgi:hypothetical protein